MKRVLVCWVLFLTVVTYSTLGIAQVSDISIYDKNGDGKLDTEKELPILNLHIADADLRKNDKNVDGKVDRFERSDAQKEQRALARQQQGAFILALDGRTAIPIEEAAEKWAEKKPEKFEFPIKLRKSFKEVTVLKGINKSLDDEPATASYKHDFQNSNDIWTARGALIYPFYSANISEGARSDNFLLQSVASAFGVSFDFVSNEQNRNRETGALGLHASTQFEFGGGFFQKQYLTFEGTFTNDFRSDSQILNADVDWRPLMAPLGINAIRYFGRHVGVRTTAVARLRVGTVLDSGTNPALAQNEFVRLGAEVGADIYIGEFYAVGRWLHASVNWEFREGIDGSPGFADDLEASLNYYPDANQNFSLNVNYRNGDVPLVQKRVEELTVGLGVKF